MCCVINYSNPPLAGLFNLLLNCPIKIPGVIHYRCKPGSVLNLNGYAEEYKSRVKGKIRKQKINPGGIRFGARGPSKTSKACNEEKVFPPGKDNNSH